MSLLDFLLELEDKEIKFYSRAPVNDPKRLLCELIIKIDNFEFSPIKASIYKSVLYDQEALVKIITLPETKFSNPKFFDTKYFNHKLDTKYFIHKLLDLVFQYPKVKEILYSLERETFKEEKLLFKFKTIDNKIEFF